MFTRSALLIGNGASGPEGSPIDVLSSILGTVHLRSMVGGLCELSAPWGIRFPARPDDFPPQCRPPGHQIPRAPRVRLPSPDGAFHALIDGRCLLQLNDASDPVVLAGGDLVMLFRGPAHVLRDSLDSPIKPIWEVHPIERARLRSGLRIGGGGVATRLIHGVFFLASGHDDRLLSALPPILHLKAEHGRPTQWLKRTLRLLQEETSRYEPGAQSIIDDLTHLLLVRAVRGYLANPATGKTPWLGALFDPEIGPALDLIRNAPEAPWTVASLADAVAISRSVFAARFKAMVGQPPLEYLTRCRMQRAADMLRRGQASIKEVAASVGYDSEAALSKAFKRTMGMAPSLYRQDARSAGDVVAASPDRIAPPPANIHGVQGRYFEGVYQANDRLIAILNADAVLSEQETER